MPVRIAPSILSADFGRLADEIRAVEAAGADLLHVDVMDGRFVPNITIGPPVVRAIRPVTRLPLDVHLMIEDPDRYIEAFVAAGADWVSVHVEACRHLHRTVQTIRELGARAGAVLNPATPAACLEAILPDLDFVLVMSVNPGFGGQSFIPGSLAKIRTIRGMIDRLGGGVDLEVDGGVNPETIAAVAAAGADVCVAGSAVYGAGDYAAAIDELKRLAEAGDP
ncbi:ribulose-phosphate 3-epimerase [Dissulfurirhabdus thermomarina]|uniref:Ribulose-phosphate 3-epimerase n=1 Tax=Dissulfurirhabdus thermomarina TaxID=1765737 RepID=A0A6N9TPI0_DISTH|nr:ribulose-phosphate 3-epimerase [Dissulfurirhabdus thermomarina]NDY42003.1 ribulose-phosphate 3-epimerase [Dissulfurirhabdus thermomarina]NMX24012.1 ribulose-phosphate 3-epimerase [Dissulfurirhabdus thermomarina]